LPERPRLKETIDVFRAASGRVYLYRGGDSDFELDDPDGSVCTLLAQLDGTRGLDTLEAPGLSARSAVAQLAELGLVEDASADRVLAPRDRGRYDRQLRYFGDVAPAGASRAQYQACLRDARVVVLGLGGLGGWSALALASAGVGTLVGVDGDAVEFTNLNRQVLFTEADVGRPKVAVAAERLASYNSRLRFEPVSSWLESAEQIATLVAGADFVVDAVDTPVHDIEVWVNEACFAVGVPYITMSQFPPLVRIGPTYVPGRTGCYRCQEAEWREIYPLFDELVAHRRQRPAPAASFGPACALIGGFIALEVAHSLSGIAEPATCGRALTLDIRTFATTEAEVRAAASCGVCGFGAKTTQVC
jgi:bacteriocin biosynthesis cyclodehydratase domain-containing protein